ncbi:uncharacterized protein LOC127812796 [Diospyros lotus]|uniref:uncharacterized protein LOC127812796 n=1 Tax=Diospyros lotus TaxID=55363 RepID=UPI002256663A|nr:uncharacterized protein LOC127812796 [Diospyros lotus]
MVTRSNKKKGKLGPRYIGPYDIVERIGPVAYRLVLPLALSNLHDVFHVSQLRKHEPDPSQVMPVEAIEIQENLSYVEKPVSILDRRDQVLRNKSIFLVQVLWRNPRQWLNDNDDSGWAVTVAVAKLVGQLETHCLFI